MISTSNNTMNTGRTIRDDNKHRDTQTSSTAELASRVSKIEAFIASRTDQTDLTRLQAIEGFMSGISKAVTVLPEDADLPENKGRQVSKAYGFNFIPDKAYTKDSYFKQICAGLAAPALFEIGKIPLGTMTGAVSNVSTFLSQDAKTHAKSWWDTASGIKSNGSKWLREAATEASEFLGSTSVDNSTLLKLGAVAGLATATGYGACRWYNAATASTENEDEENSAQKSSAAKAGKSRYIPYISWSTGPTPFSASKVDKVLKSVGPLV